MKLIIIILLALPLNTIAQVKANQKTIKCQTAVKSYLSKTLNDNKSYQPVFWGKLDSAQTDFEKTERFIFVNDLLRKMKLKDRLLTIQLSAIKTRLKDRAESDKRYLESKKMETESKSLLDSVQLLLEKERSAFIPSFSHYLLQHKFRAKNGFNATILYNYEFTIDKKFNVTDAIDLIEFQRKVDELIKSE